MKEDNVQRTGELHWVPCFLVSFASLVRKDTGQELEGEATLPAYGSTDGEAIDELAATLAAKHGYAACAVEFINVMAVPARRKPRLRIH